MRVHFSVSSGNVSPFNFPNMTRITCLLALLCLCGCAIHSQLTLPAEQTFVLGGNGNGAFKVRVSNIGPTGVGIATRLADGQIMVFDTLLPGQSAQQRFVAGSAALLQNPQADTGFLSLRITGDVRLGMGYQP
jgi:hypothetical protein